MGADGESGPMGAPGDKGSAGMNGADGAQGEIGNGRFKERASVIVPCVRSDMYIEQAVHLLARSEPVLQAISARSNMYCNLQRARQCCCIVTKQTLLYTYLYIIINSEI